MHVCLLYMHVINALRGQCFLVNKVSVSVHFANTKHKLIILLAVSSSRSICDSLRKYVLFSINYMYVIMQISCLVYNKNSHMNCFSLFIGKSPMHIMQDRNLFRFYQSQYIIIYHYLFIYFPIDDQISLKSC